MGTTSQKRNKRNLTKIAMPSPYKSRKLKRWRLSKDRFNPMPNRQAKEQRILISKLEVSRDKTQQKSDATEARTKRPSRKRRKYSKLRRLSGRSWSCL